MVVQTHPQRENLVAERLHNLVEIYLPKIKTAAGRIAPLFPNYLFCQANQFWSPIKHCIGVRQVLMSGQQPARIPQAVILNWKSQERGGLVRLPPPPRWRKGERLIVLSGSLRNRIVLYDGMSGKDRERVLVELLGQWVPLNIPTAELATEFSKYGRRLRHRHKTL